MSSQISTRELPPWPPTLTSAQLASLAQNETDWALSHGLVYRPLPASASSPPDPGSVIHAPFALFPTPYPFYLFQLANKLQPLYNELYARVASDEEFLESVIGGSVSKVDDFQGKLWEIYKAVTKEGVAQPLHLGLFRSDYLLHSTSTTGAPAVSAEDAAAEFNTETLTLKQVEFNTISSSFGALSARVTQMHNFALRSTNFFGSSALLSHSSLPPNGAPEGLAGGIAEAHRAYGKQSARVVMVVQPGERNAFDQRWIEYELLDRHGIHLLRLSFSELASRAYLDPSTRALLVRSTISSAGPSVTGSGAERTADEISVVYFRAGYGPDDYTCSQDWETRLLLERSKAIKCPTIALQLAGAKKVQQVLSEPGVLESFLLEGESSLSSAPDPSHSAVTPTVKRFTKADVDLLRSSFAALYPLDDSPLGQEALRLVKEDPTRFVLKPQREGGGHNIYRDAILPALERMEERDRAKAEERRKQGKTEPVPKEMEAYILMELIRPPEDLHNYLLRAGQPQPRKADVVSELGIFGVALFRSPEGAQQRRDKRVDMRVNDTVGHLLRTKGREVDEGGVAAGFSVIDSPVLV